MRRSIEEKYPKVFEIKVRLRAPAEAIAKDVKNIFTWNMPSVEVIEITEVLE